MGSSSEGRKSAVCDINRDPGVCGFQSSERLKRFVMFDQSNGQGQVFFHPAVAQELFGPMYCKHHQGLDADMEVKGDGSRSNVTTFKQVVDREFSSLQSLRASRQSPSPRRKADALTVQGILGSSHKPRVLESISVNDKKKWTLAAQDKISLLPVISKTSACEEKTKVSAIPPFVEIIQDCNHHVCLERPSSVRREICCRKSSEVSDTSEPLQEDTGDLDALLSLDEEEDDDVRSTGHSPEETIGKEGVGVDDEVDNVKLTPCKRRRTSDGYDMRRNVKSGVGDFRFLGSSAPTNENEHAQSIRKLKIKSTLEALRRMIPGGAYLDTSCVLDMTIMYVRELSNRVNQVDTMRLQPQFHKHQS